MHSLLAKIKGLAIHKRFNVMLIVKGNTYKKISFLLKFFTDSGKHSAVYISFKRSAASLLGLLNEMNMPFERFFIIDAVSNIVIRQRKQKNIIFLDSAEHISDIKLAVFEALSKTIPKHSFIFLDDLGELFKTSKSHNAKKLVHDILIQAAKMNSA